MIIISGFNNSCQSWIWKLSLLPASISSTLKRRSLLQLGRVRWLFQVYLQRITHIKHCPSTLNVEPLTSVIFDQPPLANHGFSRCFKRVHGLSQFDQPWVSGGWLPLLHSTSVLSDSGWNQDYAVAQRWFQEDKMHPRWFHDGQIDLNGRCSKGKAVLLPSLIHAPHPQNSNFGFVGQMLTLPQGFKFTKDMLFGS